jgi:hypothetical protein
MQFLSSLISYPRRPMCTRVDLPGCALVIVSFACGIHSHPMPEWPGEMLAVLNARAAAKLPLSPQPTLSSRAPVLTATRLGAVVFGTRLSDVTAVLGTPSPRQNLDPDCDYVTFGAFPGARFMVENGIVSRAEIDATMTTTLGIRIGDSLNQARQRAPTLKIEPHKYDENGHTLVVAQPDGKTALVMEEHEGIITAIRGGVVPSVYYVEGCM